MAFNPLSGGFQAAQNFAEGSLRNNKPGPKFDPLQKNGTILYFPNDLASADEALRPIIRFTCFERTGKTGGPTTHRIHLPCPPNIAFSDNAQYSSIDLGQMGAVTGQATENIQSGQGIGEAIGQSVDNIDITKIVATNVGQKIAPAATGNALFANKLIKNPNTNTSYTGSGVRAYTFNFKMVANSAEESIIIKHIHQLFRKQMYAAKTFNGEEGLLRYPPTWGIDFMKIKDNKLSRNDYIPVPYACYLTACNTTFNAAADSWHSEGQPFEVDVSINFQETRNLFREDIDRLESIAGDPNNKQNQIQRGVSETGLALTQTPDQYNYTPDQDATAAEANRTQTVSVTEGNIQAGGNLE